MPSQKPVEPPPKIGASLAPYERDYRTFLSESDFSRIKKILVIANTGEVTVKNLREWLIRHSSVIHADGTIHLHLLLRSPHISDKKRAESIERTTEDILTFATTESRFAVQVRHYASVCPLRATLLEHTDQTYSGYLSFVDWGPGPSLNQRDTAHEHAFQRRNVTANDPFLSVFLSWFRHFWGINFIHTLIFDFDDTLVLTTAAQVHGWIRAIERALETGRLAPNQLKDNARNALEEGCAEKVFADIFLEEQEEDRILAQLVNTRLSSDVFEFIRDERTKAREKETVRTAELIPNVARELSILSKRYQLVIVSATRDGLIRQVLRDQQLSGLFPYIFGRDSPLRTWSSVEKKAQNFIKISTMLGVPLERMVFVGDSDADFRAASQLGMPFIENGFNAARYERRSLIRQSMPRGLWRLSADARPGDLAALIGQIEEHVR
jgi:phosphoglycolate phosphatase-like HAD superfamily hydrolase